MSVVPCRLVLSILESHLSFISEKSDKETDYFYINDRSVMKMKYSLVGINGNAFNVMGYVTHAMTQCNFPKEKREEYINKATSGDYDHLLAVSMDYIEKCNATLNDVEDEEEDD